jgi:hypothetical protein
MSGPYMTIQWPVAVWYGLGGDSLIAHKSRPRRRNRRGTFTTDAQIYLRLVFSIASKSSAFSNSIRAVFRRNCTKRLMLTGLPPALR